MTPTFIPTRTPPPLPGASLLGLSATTLLDLGDAVHDGFHPDTLDRLAAHLGLSLGHTLDLLGLSPSTYHVHRRQDRPLKPEVSAKLYHLAQVTEAAEAYFGETATAHAWLQTPRVTFGHRTPLAFALLPGGAEYVTTVLNRLEHGVYT
jgi:putative toxin-antitoxin system antitoxin component (TIGR02293 family)